MVKTRFAPSPTGFVHVGNLRAALFPYLFAKKNGGKFVLRIEDTDQERLVEGAIENLVRTLAWVGIIPDEGPVLDGNTIVQTGSVGPYIQSQRLPVYKKHVEILLEKGAAYHAFDTQEEIRAMRERQQTMKQPSKYDRLSMRNQFTLGEEETKRLLANDTPSVVRLKVPDQGEITFHDMIRGEVRVNVSEVDDQVLLKSDGFPTYHLGVVVDDHAMGITHVIRGEDWLPSTPKHILLYEAFGWDIPIHAHMPLLVNEDKKKLSKRKGDVSVEHFKEKGYLPQALVNFLAFLGWSPGTDQEIFTLPELIDAFTLERVQKGAAVFNLEKLDWFNKQYLASLPLEEVTRRALPFFVQAGLTSPKQEVNSTYLSFLEKVVDLERARVTTLSELASAVGFIFAETISYDPALLVWKKSTKEETKKNLELLTTFLETLREEDWGKDMLETEITRWITQRELKVGDVLWPMRTALSGQQHSPGPFEIAQVLGKEASLHRLRDAIQKL